MEIEDEVYERLKARAEAAGRPVEEEVQRVLSRSTPVPAERLDDLALRCLGGKGVELELPRREPWLGLEL